jgi:hypothetical protein
VLVAASDEASAQRLLDAVDDSGPRAFGSFR